MSAHSNFSAKHTNMTAPAPVPATLHFCPNPPTFRVLDRLKKTDLGSPSNTLRLGCFKLAYFDGVLLIENGAILYNMANLNLATVRVIIGKQQITIDTWEHASCSIALTATPAEMQTARTYFVQRGIAVCTE